MPPFEPAVLDLAPRHRTLLRALLERHVPGAEVWAFGSRVNGGAHQGSDLDLVLRDARQPGRALAGAAGLRDALQASALPMLVEVHEWAQSSASFRDEIERRYVVIQSAHDGEAAAKARAAEFPT